MHRNICHFIFAMGLFSLSSARAQTETYTDPAFTFEHPKGWSKLQSSTPDRLVFRDESGKMQLTVSVLNYNSSVTGQALLDGFNRILQHRMEAEKKGLATSDLLEHSAVEAIPGGYQARFRGLESGNSRRFNGLLLMSKGYILIFYVEALDKTEEELKSASDAIFSNIKLR